MTQPQVQLISKPQIDSATLIKIVAKACGLDVGKPTVSVKTLSDYEIFLSYLAVLHDENVDLKPLSRIKEISSIHDHLNFTFLITASSKVIMKSMERTRLKHTIAATIQETHIAVVTGSLPDWKLAFIECTSPECDFSLKLLYDKIFLQIKEAGIKVYFSDLMTKPYDDNTFRLEQR